jgi:hypothetical protein
MWADLKLMWVAFALYAHAAARAQKAAVAAVMSQTLRAAATKCNMVP